MLAVGRLVRIVKTIGDKVISKSRFYNTFNYLGYEREVGDWPTILFDHEESVFSLITILPKNGQCSICD